MDLLFVLLLANLCVALGSLFRQCLNISLEFGHIFLDSQAYCESKAAVFYLCLQGEQQRAIPRMTIKQSSGFPCSHRCATRCRLFVLAARLTSDCLISQSSSSAAAPGLC